VDGDRPFQRDGAITFVPPTDWASTTVNTQAAYWIRARCNVTVDITQIPLTDSKEHLVVSPVDGPTMPYAATITGIRLIDAAATLHTTADVKFILMDFTKGTNTAALTFAQDKRQDSWGTLTMECDAGDVLGVLVTQEDGTNEVTDATLELKVTF